MNEKRYFMVAGHRFGVSGGAESFALMDNYEPFACTEGETVFDLAVASGDAPAYTEEMRQEEEKLRVGELCSGMAPYFSPIAFISLVNASSCGSTGFYF